MSSIVRARRAIGVAALVVAISAAALMAGGAGAGSQSPLALPRTEHAVHLGHGLGTIRKLQPAALRALDRHGRTAVRDALPVRPARGQVHPVACHKRQVGRPDVRHDSTLGREVERREATDGSGREVHVRDRQARGLRVLDDVEDGPLENHRQGQHRQLRVLREAELPRLGHEHVHDPDRAEARLVGLQRHRDHDR